MNKIKKAGIIFGITGVILALMIVIVSLTAYHRVYFFDGYAITKVLWVIAALSVVTGLVLIAAGSRKPAGSSSVDAGAAQESVDDKRLLLSIGAILLIIGASALLARNLYGIIFLRTSFPALFIEILLHASLIFAGALLVKKRTGKLAGAVLSVCTAILLYFFAVDLINLFSYFHYVQLLLVLTSFIMLITIAVLAAGCFVSHKERLAKFKKFLGFGPIVYLIINLLFADVYSKLTYTCVMFGMLFAVLALLPFFGHKNARKVLSSASILTAIANLGYFISSDYLLKGHTVGTGASSIKGLYTGEVLAIESNIVTMGIFSAAILIFLICSGIIKKNAKDPDQIKLYKSTHKTVQICFVASLIGLALNGFSYIGFN